LLLQTPEITATIAASTVLMQIKNSGAFLVSVLVQTLENISVIKENVHTGAKIQIKFVNNKH
jgi:hypothetical protein